MSGNDVNHFPVKTGKFAFLYPEPNVYQRQPLGYTHIQNSQVPGR